MPPTQPSPKTWTLRLKHHTLTILLHIDPLQPLTTVKTELLRALQQTHPNGQRLNGQAMPESVEGVLLAKMRDINDYEGGWESLETGGGGGDGVKGKGKAMVNGTGKGAAKGGETVQSAGLRDGGVVAFKFTSESRGEDTKDVDDDHIIAVGPADRKEEWDVVVPTMEETYAESLLTPVAVGDEGLGEV